MKHSAILFAMVLLTAPSAAAAENLLQDRDCAGDLRGFIKDYLASHSEFGPDLSTKLIVAKTSLGPRDPEAYIVYVMGGGWCGSGGCNTLIISKRSCRFGAVGFIPATELPISVEPAPGLGDADVIVSVRNVTHRGMELARLRREVDTYEFRQRQPPVDPQKKMLTVIPEDALALPLY